MKDHRHININKKKVQLRNSVGTVRGVGAEGAEGCNQFTRETST